MSNRSTRTDADPPALKRLYWEVVSGLKRATWRRQRPFGENHAEYHRWIEENERLTDRDRGAIARHIAAFTHKPLISVVMPTHNTPARFLKRAIDSVRAQLYDRWELCIADDASTELQVRQILDQYAGLDTRIRVIHRERNGHIAAASNSALDVATGEFVALLDHDDEIAEHALYLVAAEINEHPDADLIYSDGDKLDKQGRRHHPHFKSGWNPELLLGQNYFSHLGVYRRTLIEQAGRFRAGLEGSQDHDLVLRCAKLTEASKVRHIPHVLYHWRAIAGSTALRIDYKSYAADASVRALQEHLGDRAEASCRAGTNYRIRYRLPEKRPKVSIVIPTRDACDLVRNCIESIAKNTSYSSYEIVVVDNGSRDEATLDYLRGLERTATARVVSYDHPFNFSAINNFGVSVATGSLVCFMNNDVTTIHADWLDELVSHAVRPDIGAVGAKLLYPDETIQHAGLRVGLPFIAIHPYRAFDRRASGYCSRLNHAQDVTAVTAACMVSRKDAFEAIGGFDAEHLPVAYNDVDLCLKLRKAGLDPVDALCRAPITMNRRRAVTTPTVRSSLA